MPKKGYKATEEHRRKNSEVQKRIGHRPPLGVGKKFQKRHQINKGRIPWNKGKHTGFSHWLGKNRPSSSEETKKRMSETHRKIGSGRWNRGKHHTEEVKRRIGEALKGEKSPNWQGGISFEPYSVDWTETLKRGIRERDKYTCQLCNKEPSVICHHIDYDKKNCNSDNLIVLCRGCHAKTNFNRQYWKQIFNDKILRRYFK